LIAGSHGVPAALPKKFGRPPLGSPIQLFDSAGHRAGTLFEHRPARVAEIGLVLPQALFDPGGVSNVARAQSLKASGAHAALCSGVPRLSCAKALVTQRKVAAAAMERQLNFEIMSDHSFDCCRFWKSFKTAALQKKSGLQRHSRAHKKLNTGT
jgi:hypothetical protein